MREWKILQTAALAAGVLLFAGGRVMAQEPAQTEAAPEQAPADAPKHMHHPKLNLTDDQKAQVKKIHESAKSQMEAVRNDSSLSAEQKDAKSREIRRSARKEMSGVLTPEQREVMKERHKRHHARMKRQAPPQTAPEAQPPQQQQ